MAYVLRVRSGPKVERLRLDGLDAALREAEARGRELQAGAGARVIDTKVRRFEPVQQVTGRVELSGPGRLRAGIDVRGDGSAEAYRGRIRREVIERRRNESPYDALRRVVKKW